MAWDAACSFRVAQADGVRHVDAQAAVRACEANGVRPDLAAPLVAAIEAGLLAAVLDARRAPEDEG